MNRSFDLVVFGATGFTGRQAAHYLAAHPDRHQFRFALAARSQTKLDALVEELAADGLTADGVIAADALDAPALSELAQSTRVVLSTAGPFAKFGSELVRACVEHRTHYVDITGETPWVRSLIDEHHERAAREGTRIIPCCGFDSVPSDLGALFAADLLHRETGRLCAQVRAYHRGAGGINGGTVASMFNMQSEGSGSLMKDPFLLNPEGTRPKAEREHRDPVAPFYASEARCWAAPFFMGPINTRVVRRSHALLRQTSAGKKIFTAEFLYQEYWKASGLFGLVEASAFAAGQPMAQLATSLPGVRGLLEKAAPKPGTGPSEATMDNGYFSCDLYAQTAGGSTPESAPKSVHARLSGEGDPGNRITIKCVCESALLLALQAEDLSASPGGGVLTPASGLGLALVPRLERAGIEFAEL
jgi:short subunit dehydrogenase-like uncharacterized protein